MLEFEELAGNIVNSSYINQGMQSLRSRAALLKTLLSERCLPKEPWTDATITLALEELSAMDSNNFLRNAGVGEREGRVYSALVRSRHTQLSHGIGRSGDLDEVQPKAAGSSLIYKLTISMTLHALHLLGLTSVKRCLVVPMATGMSLALCLLTVKAKLAASPEKRYVIWPRIDQKSCYKCMLTAGLIPLVVETSFEGDAIATGVAQIEALLTRGEYCGKIAAVLSTTSCFAPRRPDRIDDIARLCAEHDVAHIINNAYGLQCPGISRLINRAATVGRVDYIVNSTDKNFMVPVGGAVVASPHPEHIAWISKMYPGRASISPILDLFMTLLSMGRTGLQTLVRERLRLLPVLIDGLGRLAAKHGERLLLSPTNSISIALSLSTLHSELLTMSKHAASSDEARAASVSKDLSFLGAMLFQRGISGTRVIPLGATKTMGADTFSGWGSSAMGFAHPYLTAACALGLTEAEVGLFLQRLDKALVDFRKKRGLASPVSLPFEDLTGHWLDALASKNAWVLPH